MTTIAMIDKINRQHAALIHLASTCDDEGLAICIENVADALERIKADLEKETVSNRDNKEWNELSFGEKLSLAMESAPSKKALEDELHSLFGTKSFAKFGAHTQQ